MTDILTLVVHQEEILSISFYTKVLVTDVWYMDLKLIIRGQSSGIDRVFDVILADEHSQASSGTIGRSSKTKK